MDLLEVVEVKLEWSDLDHLTYHPRRDTQDRSGGLHVSDILRHKALEHNLYTQEDREDEMPLRILLGLAFEEGAARLYRSMFWQPGETTTGTISGNPDGLDVVQYPHIIPWDVTPPKGAWIGPRVCVDEFKYTGKSQRVKGAKPDAQGRVELKDIRSEWIWVNQVMSYINMIRRDYVRFPEGCYRDLDLGRFHICWKYGAYKFPMTEMYMRYLIRFTEPELAGNWALMRVVEKQVGEGMELLK